MKKLKYLLLAAILALVGASCNLNPEQWHPSWYTPIMDPIKIHFNKKDQKKIFEDEQELIPLIRQAHGSESNVIPDLEGLNDDSYLKSLYQPHLINVANYSFNMWNTSAIKPSLDKLVYSYMLSDYASGVMENNTTLWLNGVQGVFEDPYEYPFFYNAGNVFSHEVTHFLMHDWGLESAGHDASYEVLDGNKKIRERVETHANSAQINYEHIDYSALYQMEGYEDAFDQSEDVYIDNQEPFAHTTSGIGTTVAFDDFWHVNCIPEEFMDIYFAKFMKKKENNPLEGNAYYVPMRYDDKVKIVEYNNKGQATKRVNQENGVLDATAIEFDDYNYCVYFTDFKFNNPDNYWNSENASSGNLEQVVYQRFDKNNYEIQQEVFGQDYYTDNGLFDYLILTDYDANGNWENMRQIYPLDAGKEVSPQELKEMLYTGDFSSVESSSSRYTTNRNTANEIYNYIQPQEYHMRDLVINN